MIVVMHIEHVKNLSTMPTKCAVSGASSPPTKPNAFDTELLKTWTDYGDILTYVHWNFHKIPWKYGNSVVTPASANDYSG